MILGSIFLTYKFTIDKSSQNVNQIINALINVQMDSSSFVLLYLLYSITVIVGQGSILIDITYSLTEIL